MIEPRIRIRDLKDCRQHDYDQEYWQAQPQEDRLSAVEVLRRQYSMFSSEERYDGSKRLRRVLRIMQ